MSEWTSICPTNQSTFRTRTCRPTWANAWTNIVLFKRQTSLHRVSIMSHRVKMNIHAPQTLMARAEAQILMNASHNFAAHKAAEPLMVPLQDTPTSIYLLTLKCIFLGAAQVAQLMDFMDD